MLDLRLAPERAARLLLAAQRQPETVRVAADVTPHHATDNAIHRAADSCLKSFTVAIRYAFAMGRRAIRSVAVNQCADVAAKTVHDVLLDVLPSEIAKAMTAGGDAAVSSLRTAEDFRAAKQDAKKVGPVTMRFDVTSPDAVEWAKQHAAELAKGLSETTRDDIGKAIADSLESGDDPYDDILDAVGDDARAAMIARTETMTAANQGTLEAWSQATDAGLLTGDEKKTWIATSGCCDECDDLDEETVGIDEDFSSGEDAPPAHPNCRCTIGIVGG